MNDLISGKLNMVVDTLGTSLPQHRSGDARILAVASETRLSIAPDIPTLTEVVGSSGFSASLSNVVSAPAGTPADIVARLNAATRLAMAELVT